MAGVGGGAILSVRDLHHQFGGQRRGGKGRALHAIRGVTFQVEAGECLALVGESGCGKTTLARILLRLIRPSRGSVTFRGRDVFRIEGRELMSYRRSVQMVFQDPAGSLNPRIRGGQMLEEVLRVHKDGLSGAGRSAKVRDLLSQVGLDPEVAGRSPHELSGGQRQRLAIARALSVEPEVLILDEPVSALDVSVQAQVLNLLTGLQASIGLTFVFITHDLSVVRHVADRVGVLYLGEMVEMGPASEVFAHPLHPYTAVLLEAARAQEERVPAEAGSPGPFGEPPSPVTPPGGCAFHPRCPHPSKGRDCASASPPLRHRSGPRKVACWRVEEHLADP